MSTNIHFEARRQIQVVKTGLFEEQVEHYRYSWQTPTVVTRDLMTQADPIQAYRDWILSVNEDYEVDIYAADDLFREGEPIGTETHNEGQYHIKDFDAWVDSMTKQGYDIVAVAW